MENEIIIRTEDIKDDDLLDIYVETESEKRSIESLMNKTPVLLIGSRGTGKTMLLRVAEKRIDNNFNDKKILAVRVSFNKSLLIDAYKEPLYFRQWMLSKILFSLKRKIQKLGIANTSKVFDKFFTINNNDENLDKIEQFVDLLEESFNNKQIDLGDEIRKILGVNSTNVNIINELDYFKALIEDICEEYKVDRIVILFDEACHNFIPIQQREFFTLYRDLRSPYITCKAAVYPGITSYGDTFQKFHDTTIVRIEKDIKDLEYVSWMRDIVRSQIEPNQFKILEQNGDSFDLLIYASSGNPRLLLKSILVASNDFKKLRTDDVNSTVKTFYRSDIWFDHTKLGEKYKGHKAFIDWGRSFLENKVVKDINKRNQDRNNKGVKYQTIYFAINKDAPEAVKASIRILEYSGIISLSAEGVKGTYSEIYDRYQVNMGVLLADELSPSNSYKGIIDKLSTRNNYYPEYGMNSLAYDSAPVNSGLTNNLSLDYIMNDIMEMKISALDFSNFQKEALNSISIFNIGDILRSKEEELRKAKYIGNKRSRKIYNVALNAAFEYISG